MRTGQSLITYYPFSMYIWADDTPLSIQFNVVSKGLGSARMSFYLNEAAGDIRDLLLPALESAKAKL